ncbi:MAG: ABC transporter ATP-binding protein [Rhodobacter sp.]|nr:ABC transporter ATP-binding protein [Rhodobacter sp.]MCY4169216.1 ABC transporter ATP-binding protein [Rhodobacter sp.]MCY4243110.1 ABC transporter ATP-binding protein [Rhodobacter sp.]
MSTVLRLDRITKRFGGVTANDDVTLKLKEGEILALLGENGAGKTTLMNILFGHYAADEGTVKVFGKTLPPGRPRAAIKAGVGMVHQHFTLAGNLSVLDNVMLGSEPLLRAKSRCEEGRARLLALSEQFGLTVDPDARVLGLSIGERQRVEILKALYRDARILILDEPTAVLARPEAHRLFDTLRSMTRQGLSIIFISHKLNEVMAASDRITILREGRIMAERTPTETSSDELAELMVGCRVTRPKREAHAIGPPRLVAEDVTVHLDGKPMLKGVSFTVHAGEILGIVGVSGNGQVALGALLSGVAAPETGRLTLEGREIGGQGPRAFIAEGVGRIPEDRHAEGVVGELSVWENGVLEHLATPEFSTHGFVRRGVARCHAADLIKRFDVRGATPEMRIRLLSGGNIQKLILGRVLAAAPKVIIANQPTRGLDEGAIAAVHGELLSAREAGAATILISEDLEEAVGLSDRLQAIVGGRLSQPVAAERADSRRLGLMMAGVWEELGDAA